MTEALGRVARVVVQQLETTTSDEAAWFRRGFNAITIEGLRVAFRVVRGLGARPKPAEIKIYNLAEQTRADLGALPLQVHLEAGYASDVVRRVVSGDLRTYASPREGTTRVTILEVADGDRAWRGATLDRSYRRGVPLVEVLRDAARSCGLSLPSAVEADPALREQLPGGYVAGGGALQQLERLLARYGYDVSVQDGALQVIGAAGARAGEVVVVGEDQLVGPPTVTTRGRRRGALTFRTVLDARLAPGSLVQIAGVRDLDSGTIWRVGGVQHEGDNTRGPWHTTCEARAWMS